MKKGLFLLLMAFFAMSNVNAQTSIGGGVLFTDVTAVELKADFGVADKFSVSPSVDYFLLGKQYGSNVSMFMFGVDGHYNLGDPQALNFYPLLGLNYFSITYSGEGYSGTWGSGIGLTAGGGATYALSDSMKLYGELKYVRSGLGISAGILFNL